MDVVTRNVCPPVPSRAFDWQAFSSEYDEGQPIGHGQTEAEAVRDLIIQIADEDVTTSHAAGDVVTAFGRKTTITAVNEGFGVRTYKVDGAGGWLRADELSAGSPVLVGLYAWASEPGLGDAVRYGEFAVIAHPADGDAGAQRAARSVVEREVDGADRPYALLGWASAGDAELAAAVAASGAREAPAPDGSPIRVWTGALPKVGALAVLMRNRVA